jgi:zinc transport system substrate-binding protein
MPANRFARNLIAAAVALACPTAPAAGKAPEKIIAAVGILPMEYFVERVGGTHVEAHALVAPGQSPHIFEPTPKQMADLAGARVYFSSGMPFEDRLVEKISQINPGLSVVNAVKGVRFREMEEPHGHRGHAGVEGLHAEGKDPHVWLSTVNAKIIASNIGEALKRLDPQHAAAYGKNLAEFHADIDRVHASLTKSLAPFRGKKIFVYHAAFGYFADEYGLKQVPVEIGGKEPGPRQLASLIDEARAEGVTVIFVQPQFSPKCAMVVARAIGGAVVPLDDLARDYLKNLDAIASMIVVLSPGSPTPR